MSHAARGTAHSVRIETPVVAIDGPAASGKSSTAAAVARKLGFAHIDSGACYRALTWIAVHHQAAEPAAILAHAGRLHTRLERHDTRLDVHIDGVDDVEAALRAPEVNARVSGIASMPRLRDWVNARLRAAVSELPGAVIDGRDIGTVVFPEAGLKVFLTASAAARAERRLRQRGGRVDPLELAAETASLEARDRLDTERATAPLSRAPDAVELDTTGLGFDEQVSAVVALARQRGLTAR